VHSWQATHIEGSNEVPKKELSMSRIRTMHIISFGAAATGVLWASQPALATAATHDTICVVTVLPTGLEAPDVCVVDPRSSGPRH
jgi:hypothetical protein